MVPSRVMPALLTRISIGPCSAWIFARRLAGGEIAGVELDGGDAGSAWKASAAASLPA
jgi:hypothetical protein